MTSKPWSGRFQKETDKAVEAYTVSLHFDWRLYRHDIAGSVAHARMLGKQGIIPQSDAEAIVGGLEEIRQEIEQSRFPFRDELEDIHMNIEARLVEKIGDVGRKLHTGRSRNDQIALDMRLFIKDAASDAIEGVRGLQRALLEQAEAQRNVVMSGFTHLQHAQPVLLAHHLLAFFHMLERDAARFADALRRADVLPLGSGALAGVPYPIDREAVARELGFAAISANSIDAVADRDFVVEFQAAAAIAMMHLSRLAEEIILWSTAEFAFVELDDAFATGSSIMPQKKNPDVAELARGKTGRVYGHLMGILTTLKSLPLAYNRDLQEDKEGLFDTVDTLLGTLAVFAGMMGSLRFKAERMRQAAGQGYILATDVADYLAMKGLPFRDAHAVVGRLVRYAEERRKELSELALDEYRQLSPLFEEDILRISLDSSVAARNVPGGTAPEQVERELRVARERLATNY